MSERTTLLDNEAIYAARIKRTQRHSPSLLKHMYVERGSLEDWRALQDLHYKGHTLAAGPKFYRCIYDDGVEKILAGVLVFGNPRPLDSGRNQVFPFLKPNSNGIDNRMVNQDRMHWINRNIAWNNRTVLDTMFRGAGVAYRFKNIAYRMCPYRYVESRSSMSRFNPFSIKAGMKMIRPKASVSLEEGIQFFAGIVESEPYDYVGIKEEIEAMSGAIREHTLTKLREFYYKKSSQEKSGDKRLLGMTRINGMELGNLIKQVQQIVFGATIYAIYINPEFDAKSEKCNELADQIYLSAFDEQPTDQPLGKKWKKS